MLKSSWVAIEHNARRSSRSSLNSRGIQRGATSRAVKKPLEKGASRVVKNGSVVSILRVSTKRGGDDEKTGGVSTEIR
jgi:hypothetical protein